MVFQGDALKEPMTHRWNQKVECGGDLGSSPNSPYDISGQRFSFSVIETLSIAKSLLSCFTRGQKHTPTTGLAGHPDMMSNTRVRNLCSKRTHEPRYPHLYESIRSRLN